VRNTAIEKVDWLLSEILTQLVEFVPANIKSGNEVIEKLENLNSSDLSLGKTFFSLDVVNLYPSIKIAFGIEAVLELAEKHWGNIDHWCMTIDDLKKCLTFVCYNYEITVADATFLQIKGCPMGAHFAPPFAIITMHKVETLALDTLKQETGFSPSIYLRYIDDILIGPVETNGNLPHKVLDTFNSVNDSIKFTVEVPKNRNALNFLDMTFQIKENKIEYSWYVKPCHSENSLKQDSFVPNHVKKNFVTNYVSNVDRKCSNDKLKAEAQSKLRKRLNKNGFTKIPRTGHRPKNKRVLKTENRTIFQMDFLSDRCNRKVNKIIQKYDFNIQLASKPAKYLKHCLGSQQINKKHDDCEVCSKLPESFKCDDRFLVYKFTCTYCNQFYIGETCRPFKLRYNEHRRNVGSRNKISALAEHAINCHSDRDMTIADFDLDIVKKCTDPLTTRLTEANTIDRQRPHLNRKHERI
jgi:hypothetical protein